MAYMGIVPDPSLLIDVEGDHAELRAARRAAERDLAKARAHFEAHPDDEFLGRRLATIGEARCPYCHVEVYEGSRHFAGCDRP